MESFTKEKVFEATAQQLIPENILSSFTNFFAGATESEAPVGDSNFGKILRINVLKMLQRGSSCFLIKNFRSRHYFTMWNPLKTRPLRILL